jgi:predicted amidophosphoribosyltransferase
VVLVDDLITSGATASSAAGALREAGARRIILLGLARTPRPGETEDDDG